ncbi:MAG: hypothetical protein KIT84_17935 [Labilithrix sp.]|nr:hypothetical protein [Labilithrix sp.]MCW5812913.1 hypothetical protein [Labilithrix sp.]
MRARALALLVPIAIACGSGGWDAQSKVNSVRMFGVRADKPYASAGETVTLETLVADGRRDKVRELKTVWIPVVCVNPREDLYYACFIPSQTADGTPIDGGARLEPPFPVDGGVPSAAPDGGAAGLLASIPRDVDLSAFLPQGNTFTFQMPEDVLKERPGTVPYGLVIIFNIACAGQVRIADRQGNAPQQVPIRCTDENGGELGPNDYVIGINRVYSYADRTNANPVVEKITLDGKDVDLDAGITIDRCVASRRADCFEHKIDVKVTPESWEEYPEPLLATTQREQVWATYYTDLGDFNDAARLLFDTKAGRISDSDIKYRAPNDPGDGTIWIVTHDNRAGAAFTLVPLHVK